MRKRTVILILAVMVMVELQGYRATTSDLYEVSYQRMVNPSNVNELRAKQYQVMYQEYDPHHNPVYPPRVWL
jgi:hypothetical protein